MPIYFFRGTFTRSTTNVPMAYVQWIPFILDVQNRTTSHGRIALTIWNQWPERNSITLNPFVSTISLTPSRFALAFIPPTAGTVYVDVAFIALDAENHVKRGKISLLMILETISSLSIKEITVFV